MKARFSFVLLAAAAAPAFAQPAPKPAPSPALGPKAAEAADDPNAFERDLDALFVANGLTADQAASRSAAVSPTVKRRVAEVEAQIAGAEATELQQVPQIGGKLQYTRNSVVPPFTIPIAGMNIAIPSSLANNYVAEANVNINLSDYIYRYPKLVKAAKLGLEVAKTSKASAMIDAGQDGRLAYYEWLRAKLNVLVAQRQLVQIQATVGQIRSQFEVQRVSKADLLRVESQEAEAEQTLDQLKNLSALREEQLRLLIGATNNESLALGEDVRKEVTAPAAAPLDDAVHKALAQRLDVRVLVQGIAAKEHQAEAENSAYLPRLTAFGVADYARPNQRIFPVVDEFRGTWSAGVQLSWTLNDTLIASTTQHRIRAETDELRADQENLIRGARIEVLNAQQAVQLAVHALQTSAKGLQASEEGYRVRKELLNAERATAVELVDAETDLTRARINALNARVDLRVAMTQLVHALGDDAAATK
ncbi:MAG TPA: TolC family protein [Kofleriaceae bacterium]|nr:TolC family protein [Kofleriaceae bacterium]